jgi:hypothetical protein
LVGCLVKDAGHHRGVATGVDTREITAVDNARRPA